jgi:hypothetical protein
MSVQEPYLSWMQDIGWKRTGGDGRMNVLRLDLTDRIIVSFATFDAIRDRFRYYHDASLTTLAASAASEYIGGVKGWLVQQTGGYFETAYHPTPEFIADCTGELRVWAQSFDCQKEIQRLALQESGHGLGSLSHLVALAILGDKRSLNEYLALKEASSKDLHLSNAIKLQHIKRAIEIAEGRILKIKPISLS